MKTRNDLLVLSILLIVIIATGFFLPSLLSERKASDISLTTTVPTATAKPPLISIMRTPTYTPPPVVSVNCTYHSYYWKERPTDWPEAIMMGEKSYRREEMRQYFNLGSNDLYAHLLTQMYTAFLNILYGAEISTIQEVLLQADNWLASNPPGSELSEFNRIRGREITGIIEGYNLGVFGPGACLDVPPTPTHTPRLQTSTPDAFLPINLPPLDGDIDDNLEGPHTGETTPSPSFSPTQIDITKPSLPQDMH